MGENGRPADLKSQAGYLEQAQEEFVLTFLGGLYRFSHLRNAHVVLVRRMELSGPWIPKIMVLTMPIFSSDWSFCVISIRGKILRFQMLNVES